MKNTYGRWKYAEEAAGDLVDQKIPFVIVPFYDVEYEDLGETFTRNQFVIVSEATMEEEEWRAGWPIVILLVQWIKNKMTRRD